MIILLRLKIELSGVRRTQEEEKATFGEELDMLVARGAMEESEVVKIGALNAELFGHTNTRQKIKHVARLKEENICLREVA